MFKLIRRVSSSLYSRPDRPWSEDATSSAPTIGRKRRVDDEEDDEVEQSASIARKRRVAPGMERQASDFGELAPAGKEMDASVKAVTQGVKEVELEAKPKGEQTDSAEPASTSAAVDAESSSAVEADKPVEEATAAAEMPLPEADDAEEAALAKRSSSSPAPESQAEATAEPEAPASPITAAAADVIAPTPVEELEDTPVAAESAKDEHSTSEEATATVVAAAAAQAIPTATL